ncbi:type III secretion protein (plasmid) [Bradyrhizobium septentrionale]|uniref:type III secretion system stalk subunit SctO n=1 Tax=Bradyrhizobium septentrionale TaxID=1404411 RepID=UPI00140BDD22|nr:MULTISPECIES: YscO family type III secretion system apparatus protein [Bradyrhizobium]MCK7664754.1 type III secretion protein [Bradyrhizobium sp. 2S1]UGY30287.1 type III secretion protein [Bradyrhizobium septentrionale]
MRGMISDAVPRLLQLRKLRHHRQQDILRARQLALESAAAAVEAAAENHRAWRQKRLRLEAELYDSVIGETVALGALVGLKAKITSLHDQDQLLEKDIEKAVAQTDQARLARDEACNVVRQTGKQFDKCDHLARAVRDAAMKRPEQDCENGAGVNTSQAGSALELDEFQGCEGSGGDQANVDTALDLAGHVGDLIHGASDPAVHVDADRAVKLMGIRSTDRPAGMIACRLGQRLRPSEGYRENKRFAVASLGS